MDSIVRRLVESKRLSEAGSSSGVYHVTSTRYNDGDSSMSNKKFDDPGKAIEHWFKLCMNNPMQCSISCHLKDDAIALIEWASNNTDKIEQWHEDYSCKYKLDYILSSIEDCKANGCRYFYQGSEDFTRDEIGPFSRG